MDAIDERFKRIEDEDFRQNKRLDKLEETYDRINALTLSVQKIAIAVENQTAELARQSERLIKLEEEPKEHWKEVTKTVISYLVTAALAVLIGKAI